MKKNRCRLDVDEDAGTRSLRMVDVRSSSWTRGKSPLPQPNTPDLGYSTLLSSFNSADHSITRGKSSSP